MMRLIVSSDCVTDVNATAIVNPMVGRGPWSNLRCKNNTNLKRLHEVWRSEDLSTITPGSAKIQDCQVFLGHHIIHTNPIHFTPKNDASTVLFSTYRNIFRLANEANCTSLATIELGSHACGFTRAKALSIFCKALLLETTKTSSLQEIYIMHPSKRFAKMAEEMWVQTNLRQGFINLAKQIVVCGQRQQMTAKEESDLLGLITKANDTLVKCELWPKRYFDHNETWEELLHGNTVPLENSGLDAALSCLAFASHENAWFQKYTSSDYGILRLQMGILIPAYKRVIHLLHNELISAS